MILFSRWIVAGLLMIAPIAAGAAGPDQGEVGIITGMAGGTYAGTAADLTILDDAKLPLRVLPIGGKGSLQNLNDIMNLRGVDIGFVQGDALTYAKQGKLFPPDMLNKIQYIAKLYDEEVHIIARPGINTIDDLRGKRINSDVSGSGSAMTAGIILDSFHIDAVVSHKRQVDAIQELRQGSIDAIIHVGGAPIPLIANTPGEDLHFVPVPLTPELAKTYLPAQIGHDQYPNLLGSGAEPVATLAISDVMAVYGWPAGTERYRRVARFVDAFFDRFSEFQQPPRHPKWREVNPFAQVPGWPRFPEAQAYIDRQHEMDRLARFVGTRDSLALSPQDRNNLFSQYEAWKQQHPQ